MLRKCLVLFGLVRQHKLRMLIREKKSTWQAERFMEVSARQNGTGRPCVFHTLLGLCVHFAYVLWPSECSN